METLRFAQGDIQEVLLECLNFRKCPILTEAIHRDKALGGPNPTGARPKWFRLADDIMNAAQTQVMIIEQCIEDFDNAPEAAVTNQDQCQNELTNPVFRHGQIKENLVVFGRGLEGLVDGIGGLGCLLVEEFAADPVVLGQPTFFCRNLFTQRQLVLLWP